MSKSKSPSSTAFDTPVKGTFEVITLGETMAVVTPADHKPLERASQFSLEIGGAESNVALYLDQLGHSTTWVSQLGDDPLGKRILATLDRYGVNTSFVTISQHAMTGLYVKDPGLISTSVYYFRKNSAASSMSIDTMANLPLEGARLLHLTGITPGLSNTCAQLVNALYEKVKGSGTLISFDVNYRPGVWPVDMAAPTLARLANESDVVFVGLDEALRLWGTNSPEAVRTLIHGPSTLVVKDGATGATEFARAENPSSGDVRVFVEAPAIEVVEPVGAGDAFAAGYLSGLLRGFCSAERLRLGHSVAARALSSTSDFSRKVV